MISSISSSRSNELISLLLLIIPPALSKGEAGGPCGDVHGGAMPAAPAQRVQDAVMVGYGSL